MKKILAHTLLAAMLLFCASTAICSQELKARLTVENKEKMKELKKQNKLKGVEVIVAPDGYWYFLLKGKKKKYGVATQDGKVVVPVEYELGKIDYHPAMVEGFNKIPSYDSKEYEEKLSYRQRMAQNNKDFSPQVPKWELKYMKVTEMNLYCPASPVFFAAYRNDSVKLITEAGEERVYDAQSKISVVGCYVIKGAYRTVIPKSTKLYGDKWLSTIMATGSNCALYTINGDCIIKDVPSFYIQEDGSCRYTTTENSVVNYGAFLLKDKNDGVPCKFNSVMYDSYKKVWKVKKTKNSEYEVYTAESLSEPRYRDKGEELYEQNKHDAVIEFYAQNGVDAPWAKFFTGMSMYNKAFAHKYKCEATCNSLLKNNTLGYNSDFNLEEAEELYKLSISLLNSYIEEDSTYLTRAKSCISMCEKNIEELPRLQHGYEYALKLVQEKQSATAAEQQRLQQEEMARRRQIMQQMVNSISQSLQQSLSGKRSSTTRRSSNYGGYSSGFANSVGSSGSNVSNDDSSSSRRDNTDQLIYWERKKRDTEKLIEKTRTRLAKDPGNSHIKRQLESQEELLDTCNETLSRLKSNK